MKDRRSETSRTNLGDHIPEALSPEGSVSVGVRLPIELLRRIDDARGPQARSEWMREAAEAALDIAAAKGGT